MTLHTTPIARRAYMGLLLLGLLSVASASVHADIVTHQQSIVGGRSATVGEISATVAIVDASNGEFFCTGVLTTPTVVLTAAHCLVTVDPNTGAITGDLSPDSLQVAVGVLAPSMATASQLYDVDSLMRHPDFPGQQADVVDATSLGRDNDIGWLRLKTPVTTPTLAAIPDDARLRNALTTETRLTIAGYGVFDLESENFGRLHVAEVPFVRRSATEFLAGSPNQPDACLGDSGGPAYLDIDGTRFVVGIIARGVENSNRACGDGGIYTLTSAYVGWLNATLGDDDTSIDRLDTMTDITPRLEEPPLTQPLEDDCACHLARSEGNPPWLCLILIVGMAGIARRR